MRTERDALGELRLPGEAYYGIHTARALENFPLSGRVWPPVFVTALARVKLACARANLDLGHLDGDRGRAIVRACEEMASGSLAGHVLVDPLQGGAGTSTNMNVNEVLANRAIEIMDGTKGDYALVHPLDHVNLHQSTNDVFPTALKAACLVLLKDLEAAAAGLQEAFQEKEREFADVVKVARTQLMDAVPVALGMEFGAFAEALARDRWRVFKSRERLKQVNLGGTAVGTGLGAPRDYIFKASENLKNITGLPLCRAENLVEATQNLDCFVEASGMINAMASNLFKISNDLRLLGSGPAAGLGEIVLPPVQAGSSAMAGKVNPVIPEAACQAALRAMAAHQSVAMAASLGQLDLNHLLPLVAHEFMESLALLANAARILDTRCVRGIRADAARCRELVDKSLALATALVPALGYEAVERLVAEARERGVSVARVAVDSGVATAEAVEELLSPKRMRKLGFTPDDHKGLGRT